MRSNDRHPSESETQTQAMAGGGMVSVILLAGWWCWPRNDGPYVGTWQTIINGITSTMTVGPNGMGFTEVDGARFDYPYRVDGSRLTIGWNMDPGFCPAAQLIANSWSRVTGRTHVIGVQTIDIIEAGADVIRVQRPASLASQPGVDVVEWKRAAE